MSEVRDKLKSTAASLPEKPGIYFFRNEAGEVLYIGKAASLRDRVRSYFTSGPDPRISRMVSEAAAIDYILTDSEKDAFFLESNFIRQHQPRFNLRLKDDKNYPYIKITAGDRFPAVRFSRRVEADGSRYFGPFSPAGRARAAIHMVSRFFRIRSCRDVIFRSRKRPCLDYELGLCSAPCAGLVSDEEYAAGVADACLFLEGRTRELAAAVEGKMAAASEALRFEDAARWRDLLAAVRDLKDKPVAISVELEDRDTLGVFREGLTAAFCVFFIRNGRIIGTRDGIYELGPGRDEAAALLDFLAEVYSGRPAGTPIIVSLDRPETAAMNASLAAAGWTAGLVPASTARARRQAGLAARNARASVEKRTIGAAGPEGLKTVLGLPRLPRIIEGFDISNTGGEENVGSMVSFRDGFPDKDNYRKFRIRTVAGSSDTDCLAEVIGRRYRRLLDEGSPLPDLVLVDGGKGQLAAAVRTLDGLEIKDLPVISLAKKEEIIFTAGHRAGLRLERTSPALKLVQRVRDEAHRFAINFHRGLRSRKSLTE